MGGEAAGEVGEEVAGAVGEAAGDVGGEAATGDGRGPVGAGADVAGVGDDGVRTVVPKGDRCAVMAAMR